MSPEREAAADVARWRRDPSALGRLPLGAFDEAPAHHVLARRVLLALRVPAGALAPLARRDSARAVLDSYRYWRGVRRALRDRETWRRLTRGTTILMYHAIGGDGEPPSRFVVPSRSFRRQMRHVARRPSVSLSELARLRREHRLPPAGAVAVTFDDGYADTRTLASPILRRHGVPATIFVVSSAVGGVNDWERSGPLARRPLLGWDDVRELRAGGLAVGAHTRTHPVLTGLPPERLDDEVAGSRTELERELGELPEAFAYPHGKYDEPTADSVRQGGFACACTVRPGRNGAATSLYGLRRAEVRGSDSLLRFALTLAFGDRRVLDVLLRR